MLVVLELHNVQVSAPELVTVVTMCCYRLARLLIMSDCQSNRKRLQADYGVVRSGIRK